MHCRSGFKKGPTSCPPTFNWVPAIPNGRFFQRSESPRNISGSREFLDLCCMLNHFSAKLPKLSKLMIGGQGPNICIEIGAPANRRRAEGCVYVLETAFTVQRALCTFGVKVTPCRRPPLSLRNGQTLEPIRLNFKWAKGHPKYTRDSLRRRIFHFSVHFGLTCRHDPARFAKRADMCLLQRRAAQVEGLL